MKYRILTDIPGATDGCQWYRGAGPLTRMARMDDQIDLRFNFLQEPSWGELKAADILFLMRPCLESQIRLIQMAKNVGTKVWIDFDDDLFAVTEDNPNHRTFANPGTERNMERALNMADAISVSTVALQKKLQPMAVKSEVQVIPNAVDPCSFRHRPKLPVAEQLIMWRGTSTHMGDLMEFSQQIKSVSAQYLTSRFAFVGYNPWFITQDLGPRGIKIPPVDMLEFYEAICAIRPRISIVPLCDNEFNRSKSNIAALEASVAGSAILAPNWPEWDLPGVFKYNSPAEFQNLLEVMIEGDVAPHAAKTWEHVSEHCTLDTANVKRFELVRSMK